MAAPRNITPLLAKLRNYLLGVMLLGVLKEMQRDLIHLCCYFIFKYNLQQLFRLWCYFSAEIESLHGKKNSSAVTAMFLRIEDANKSTVVNHVHLFHCWLSCSTFEAYRHQLRCKQLKAGSKWKTLDTFCL